MMAVLLLAVGPAMAARPAGIEPVTGVIQAVDVAGREVRIRGTAYPVASTASIQWMRGARLSLRDLSPGMRVAMEMAASRTGLPVVQKLTVMPD